MKQSIGTHSSEQGYAAANHVQQHADAAETNDVVQHKLAETALHSPRLVAQRALDARLNDSPRMAVQRKQMEGVTSQAMQRAAEEEEPLQGKFEAMQRAAEEEEPMQGKFDPVQRAAPEEELPVQGKFDSIQRAAEEEEPLQGKFDPVQRAAEEEEPLQGKFDGIQRAAEEEEPMQGKFDPIQRAAPEEELPVQGKFEGIQRAAEEEEPLQGKFPAHGAALQLKEDAKPNNTGLPDNLKSGVESLSGMAMDDVKVHYNSSQPAQVQAFAYAQGTDIHVGPGQEQHLPHEAWHVAQQKQGRVQPTMQAKGVAINDDAGLEHEADVMGAKALQTKAKEKS